MIDYDNWDPIDPTHEAEFSRVVGVEQYAAFRVVYDVLSNHQLAPAIATLAEAWQKHRAKLEAPKLQISPRDSEI